jgi:hypothetical protein
MFTPCFAALMRPPLAAIRVGVLAPSMFLRISPVVWEQFGHQQTAEGSVYKPQPQWFRRP